MSLWLRPASSRARCAPSPAARTAATLYGLNVLARNIEDEPRNTTRFLVIGKQSVPPSGKDKTSIMLSVRNQRVVAPT